MTSILFVYMYVGLVVCWQERCHSFRDMFRTFVCDEISVLVPSDSLENKFGLDQNPKMLEPIS